MAAGAPCLEWGGAEGPEQGTSEPVTEPITLSLPGVGPSQVGRAVGLQPPEGAWHPA